MNKYRPDGWENPYEDIDETIPPDRVGIVMGKGIGFEEGADAIIKALKEQADSQYHQTGDKQRGWWVYIPDDN